MVLCFVGSSGSGKTTLLEKVVPLLARDGTRVAVIKHAKPGFDLDTPGKDSYRLRAAGAIQVMVASRQRWALLGELPHSEEEPSLGELVGRFDPAEVDVVLVEGFSHTQYPKIEVYRPAHGKPPQCWPRDHTVIAIASDVPVDPHHGVSNLDLNDPEAVVNLVRDRLRDVSR